MTETQREEEVELSTNDERQRLSPTKKAKAPPIRQMKARRRYPPRSPGLFPIVVDIFITMTLRFALVITNFFVIFTSFAYDGNDIGWVIFAEIVFTYIGFAYFVNRISHQILIYKKFFQSLNEWHDRKLDEIKNGDDSCCLSCIWFILLKLAWWIIALLKFPFIIGWAMVQSYKWYQDRRRNAESAIDLTQAENVANDKKLAKQYWKMTDRAYSIWHLGVLSKQATMILIIIQDIPLLIIAIYIVNYLGIIVYSIAIIYNLILWFKHMYDLGKFTLFYKPEHYMDHFGIKSISWSNEYGCNIIVADFYDEFEHELSTLQDGDWVWVKLKDTEELKVMIVWKNRHFKMNGDNLVLVEWDKIDKKAIEDFDNGLAKKIMVDPELMHRVNRWDFRPLMLRDDDYIKYHDHGGRDVDDEDGDDMEATNNSTEVIKDQENKPTADSIEEEAKSENSSPSNAYSQGSKSSEHVVVDVVDADESDKLMDDALMVDKDKKQVKDGREYDAVSLDDEDGVDSDSIR